MDHRRPSLLCKHAKAAYDGASDSLIVLVDLGSCAAPPPPPRPMLSASARDDNSTRVRYPASYGQTDSKRHTYNPTSIRLAQEPKKKRNDWLPKNNGARLPFLIASRGWTAETAEEDEPQPTSMNEFVIGCGLNRLSLSRQGPKFLQHVQQKHNVIIRDSLRMQPERSHFRPVIADCLRCDCTEVLDGDLLVRPEEDIEFLPGAMARFFLGSLSTRSLVLPTSTLLPLPVPKARRVCRHRVPMCGSCR